MLQKIDHQLERIMPLITPSSVIIGVLLADSFHNYLFLVPWIFAFMTFNGSLGSNIKSLQNVVTHPFRLITVMIILHLIMPLWAWGIGHLAFNGDIHTITGLTLAALIPTGVTSVMWVSIYRGNIVLALAIILIDTFLSPFIVPYSMSLFAGKQVEIDMWGMMGGLFGMVVIPSIAGMVLNELTKGKVKEKLGTRLAPFSKMALAAVVLINSSVVAPYFKQVDFRFILIALVSFFIASSGYIFSIVIGKFLKWEQQDVVTLMFTGGMRNISAGAVIAVTYFEPEVAVPVVIGMLFQQVLASIFGHLLHKSYQKPRFQQKDISTNYHM